MQAKPAVSVGTAPLVVRVAFTDMAKPGIAAQLSRTGKMSVWMKRPPVWEKMLSLHMYFEFGGHAQRAGADPESTCSLALALETGKFTPMKVGAVESCSTRYEN